MEKAEYVDRIAIRAKVCTGCTMLVGGVCRDADPCEKLIAGFLEEPSADVIPAHRKEKAHNDPLTLDELRKMDGEPVWTTTIGLPGSGRWELCTCETICTCPLHKVLRCVTSEGDVTDYDFDTYGKTWLAYRKKPEEEERGV